MAMNLVSYKKVEPHLAKQVHLSVPRPCSHLDYASWQVRVKVHVYEDDTGTSRLIRNG